MSDKNIIKVNTPEIVHVGKAIGITNKILTLQQSKAKIFMANDHQIVINGLQKVIETKKGFKVVGHSHNFVETFEKIKISGANILFTDDQMPRTNFVNDIRKIKDLYPDLKIIVFTIGTVDRLLDKIIGRINGYIDYGAEQSHILKIIARISSNKNLFIKSDYSNQSDKDKSHFITESRNEFLDFIKSKMNFSS